MLTLHRILYQRQIQVFLLLLFVVSCRKPDQVLPDGPNTINVEATVPALIYSNVKEVYLDACRTISLNSRRAMFFNWSCTSFPVASGKPRIIDSTRALAWIEKPGIGQYVFKLTVKDNLGNMAESSYALDVMEDTLVGKKPIAKAGPDLQIQAPKHTVFLDAYETFSFNPRGRKLLFKWTVIQQPAGSFLNNFISDEYSSLVNVSKEGSYKFRLQVENELGLEASDTMEVKVLPDPYKGTTRVFENVEWKRIPGAWGDDLAIIIYDPDYFIERYISNMEVKVWDVDKKDWFDPNNFGWYSTWEGNLIIKYSHLDDEEVFVKLVGVKTRVQVKFL